MDAGTWRLVRQRAGDRCEYCLLRQADSELTHHVEHIVARQHGGADNASNLALACHRCNLWTGPNLTAIDPATHQTVRLFDPRRDRWAHHFQWQDVYIEGTTAIGRATVRLLAMNHARRVQLRSEIRQRGGLN